MKVLTLYAIHAAVGLPLMLLSGGPVYQKVIVVVLFFFHMGLVLFTWGNYNLDAKEVSEKNKDAWLTTVCNALALITFGAWMLAIN